jgi:hypothetical protein
MLELHYARRSRRRHVDIPCELVTRDWDEPIRQRLSDISPYGVWVKTSFPRPIGERLVLSFTAPHGRPLTVFAEVARAVKHRAGERKSGMGLEFVDITRGERIALHWALREMTQGAKAHVAAKRLS